MADLPSNPRNPAPQNGAWLRDLPGIDEGALLDWVEGTLAPAAQADLAAAHPNLVPLVARMRRDRAVLASAMDTRAPAGLEERLSAALERDALLGLAEGEAVSESLPISQVAKPKPPRPKWMAHVPRMAMAAGLVLLVTGSAMLIMRGGRGPATGPVGNEANLATVPQPSEPRAVPTVAEPTYASADVADAPVQPEAPAQGPLILADQSPDMDDARAVALAREGRLVIRLREIGADAMARLESGRPATPRAWQITRDLPEATLALLSPAPSAPDAERSTEPFALAGTSSAQGLMRPIPYALPVARVAPAISAAPAVGFAVSARADETTLKSLRESLARTTGALVSFEESPTPFQRPGPRPAEIVLWWNQPPSTWTPRAQIPLVVELR